MNLGNVRYPTSSTPLLLPALAPLAPGASTNPLSASCLLPQFCWAIPQSLRAPFLVSQCHFSTSKKQEIRQKVRKIHERHSSHAKSNA